MMSPFVSSGLLSLSVLHGNLLISEADFRQLFPDISGYRYALIRTPPPTRRSKSANVLEDKLSDQGFDATVDQSDFEWPDGAAEHLPAHVSEPWEHWDCCWARSAWRQPNCAVCWSGEVRWACCVPPDFAEAARHDRPARERDAVAHRPGDRSPGSHAGRVAAHVWRRRRDTLRRTGSHAGIVLVVGLLAGLFAARATLRVPVLAACAKSVSMSRRAFDNVTFAENTLPQDYHHRP